MPALRRLPGRTVRRETSMNRPKLVVKRGYDRLAKVYAARRTRHDRRDAKYLRFLEDRVPPGAAVLDLGCGAGVPIAARLARRYKVLGVDFSPNQIALARRLVPDARFRRADMTKVTFPRASFSAVCSFHAIIHVPREEHRNLFRRVRSWLLPGGFFLATLGSDAWVSSDDDRFLGVRMFWSQFDAATNLRILRRTGFRIVQSSLERATFAGELEEHLYVLAQKPRRTRSG